MSEKKQKVTIVFDNERLMAVVTVDEYIGMRSGDFGSMVEVISRFVVDNKTKEYLPADEARALVGKMSMGELKDVSDSMLQEAGQEVPPPSGAE